MTEENTEGESLHERLAPHVGHRVVIRSFQFPPEVVALECVECMATLLDTEYWSARNVYAEVG